MIKVLRLVKIGLKKSFYYLVQMRVLCIVKMASHIVKFRVPLMVNTGIVREVKI